MNPSFGTRSCRRWPFWESDERGGLRMTLQSLIFISGLLHFGTLIASATVPQVLDWKAELRKLAPLCRQLIWVHGVFIVLTIIGFAALTTFCSSDLALRTPLARAVCGFIA